MADIDELRRRHEAAREYTSQITVAGVMPESTAVFQMRLPVRLQAANAAARAARDDPQGQGSVHQIKRELLLVAIIGWTNVLACDIVPDAGAEPLPCSAAAVALLLDANPDWEDALWGDYALRAADRARRLEESEKNSSAASSGSDPATVRPQPGEPDSALSSTATSHLH